MTGILKFGWLVWVSKGPSQVHSLATSGFESENWELYWIKYLFQIGCIVRAFDPTSKVKMNAEALKFRNLYYYKIGIGN